MNTLMISAGEASGDAHAANLVRALHQIDPDIIIKGMGSDQLREVGCDILVDCADIAVVGLWEVLKHYKKIKSALRRMVQELHDSPPDLLILVDYQEFNFRLAAQAKQRGIKVLFYISPQVWAWRSGRVHSIGEKIDHMAVLFPFEEKFYRDANVPCTFVGHPLVDEVKTSKDKAQCLLDYNLVDRFKVVGLFPGSRKGEVARVLPILLQAAMLLKQKKADCQFVLPMASTINEADITPHLVQYSALDVKVVRDKSYHVMQVCDAIMTASGTATLEIALMGVPNTIVYRVAPLTYCILSRMITIDNIGLVNIVAEKNIVKEFVQGKAKPKAIAAEIEKILDDSAYRQAMIAELNKVRAKLGKEGGSNNVAKLALEMLRDNAA